MQTVSEVMTRGVRSVSPQEDVQHAAQMMGELDVGVLPVCDGGRLVGMITDRDITIRSTAAGKAPQDARVEEVMSTDVQWCFEHQPIDEVMIKMGDSQIRRLPVVSHDAQHTLIGIVALADLATGPARKADVEQVVEMVSEPRHLHPGDFPTGRTGSVDGGGSKESTGQPMPAAGDSALGAGGASGTAGSVGTPPEAGGASAGAGAGNAGSTDETRARSGVGGQDLTVGGLPPA